jgi:hypothetical protein
MQAVLVGGEMETNGSSQLEVEVEEMEVDVQEDPTLKGVQVEIMDMLVEDPGELCRSPQSLLARTHVYLSCHSDVVRTGRSSRATRVQ